MISCVSYSKYMHACTLVGGCCDRKELANKWELAITKFGENWLKEKLDGSLRRVL